MKQLYLGFYIILASLVSLAISLYQKEMALLFWSVFFLVLVLVIMILHFVSSFFLRSYARQIKLFLKQDIYDGEPFNLNYVFLKQVKKFAIFYYSIEIVGVFGTRSWHTKSLLTESSSILEGVLNMQAFKRGQYDVKCYLVAKDIFGFFYSSAIINNAIKKINIFSAVVKNNSININKLRQNSASSQSSHSKTDEKFDSRKYYPGDDPRLINWKQVSHTRELFIRREERGASLVSDYVIIIYPCHTLNELDVLLEQAFALASLIENNNSACLMIFDNLVINNFSYHLHGAKLETSSYSVPFYLNSKIDFYLSKAHGLILFSSQSVNANDIKKEFFAKNVSLINEEGIGI